MAILVQSHRAPPSAPATGAVLPLRRLTFQAMATTCEVQYAAPGGDEQAAAFERAAVAWVEAFEAKYSRFRPDSLVGRINAAAGRDWVEIDREMETIFELCDSLYFMSQGVLDPTALPLLRLWDWKTAPAAIPGDREIAAARERVGWRKVERTPGRVRLPAAGMALDFGGFGKEYAVDMVARLALEQGIGDVLVDFGHDLMALGRPPGRPAWHIGLEDPFHPGTSSSSVGLSGRGIASSGDYLRSFVLNGRRYGHIVDPRTGRPVANGCIQATVVAGSCLQAGVLSTTAFILGVPAGLDFIQSLPGAEGLLVTEKARAQTRGFYQYVASP
jgi:thiamine biosynthesis lipoprotein